MVIMTHQNLSLEKYWKLLTATLNDVSCGFAKQTNISKERPHEIERVLSQRLLYFRVNTSRMGNYEEKQRKPPNSFREKGKQTLYGAFPLNDGADSTLVSLAKKPAFRLEKAVP